MDRLRFGVVQTLAIDDSLANFTYPGKGILQVAATTLPPNATFNVSWASSNSDIISIAPYREFVNAAAYNINGYGTVTITLRVLDGSEMVARNTYTVS